MKTSADSNDEKPVRRADIAAGKLVLRKRGASGAVLPSELRRSFAMASKKKFKSDAVEAIHSAAAGLYRAGAIDKTTMRAIDAEIGHVTEAGANLFLELGFSDPEAKKLHAASRKQIDDAHALKPDSKASASRRTRRKL